MRRFVLFLIGFIIRMIFIGVAEYMDRYSPNMKYTDTDYHVFSDAATAVYKGGSPFERHTYRYTPLVAYICLVNNYIHPICAKIIWCICDLLLGNYMLKTLDIINDKNKNQNFWLVAFFVLNPQTIALSTRGSNDNTISLFVYITFYYLLKKRYVMAGLFYGLSVHFKIYPIIYSIVFYFYIDCDVELLKQGKRWEAIKKNFFTKNRLIFTFVSAFTFISLVYYFYLLYGYEFLYEAYLYHFVRKDNRHNFSVYFYMIYQMYDEPSSSLLAILSFIPQWVLIIYAGLHFYFDIFLATFIQTYVFVIFNKVVTAQYFLWYTTLAILVLPSNDLLKKPIRLVFLLLIFYLAQAPVGIYSFKLEFLAENVFSEIQCSNYLWFAVSTFILCQFISNHRLSITKQLSDEDQAKIKIKEE